MAAAAMAALTASQAPELVSDGPGSPAEQDGASAADAPRQQPGSRGGGEGLPYHTDLPPLDTAESAGSGESGEDGRVTGPAVSSGSGVPATVLEAYRRAEAVLADTTPGCGLDWEVLAAIGNVESGHARGGAVDAEGTTYEPILGPQLNGDGFAQIRDTDDAVWDGDAAYDRAVGPMQFIPSTWAVWGADGNNDGREDPNNVYDAALAAGNYLCAGDRDLTTEAGLDRALLSYNHSWDYVSTVRAWLEFYRSGVQEVPDGDGPLPVSSGPGNPGGASGSGGGGRPGGGGERPGGGGEQRPGGQDGAGGTDGPSSPPPAQGGDGTAGPSPDDPGGDPGEDADGTDGPTPPGEPDPNDPSGPGPAEPGEPAPECPADPEEPEEPEGPETPGEPEGPETPGEPGEPGEPEEPGGPEEPTGPGTGTGEPGEPTGPDTGEPGQEPGEPGGPECPAEPEQPQDPDDPGSGEPGDSQPTPSGTPTETAAVTREDA